MILAALALALQLMPMVEATPARAAPGEWTLIENGSSVTATYGGRFQIRCYRANGAIQMLLSQPGQELAPRLLVSTSEGDRWIDHPVTLNGRDPLGDRMVFSRGRILLMPEGGQPYIVPTHAEIGRVIESCRR